MLTPSLPDHPDVRSLSPDTFGDSAEPAAPAPDDDAAPDSGAATDDEDDEAEAAALAELARLQESSYQRLGPVLGMTAIACDLLWELAPKQPIVLELRRRTGLNPATLAVMKTINNAEAFANLWTDRLPDYYYTLLVGRLILESPLRATLVGILANTGMRNKDLGLAIDSITKMVRDISPLTERWLIGQFGASMHDPLPDDPAQRAELAGWATRRGSLEAYFVEAAPALARASALYLESMPAPAPAVPVAPRGPFMRRTFTDTELAALRLLLSYVPTLTTLLPGQPFAAAMHNLSALQPPARVAALLQRLRDIKPGQALHFNLADCLTLLQTLQSGALLLLRASGGELVRALRRHADDPDDPDEDLRIERGRLLFLLTDEGTRTQFRATFGPLLKNFTAAVDRLYPASELTKARAELAALAAVR